MAQDTLQTIIDALEFTLYRMRRVQQGQDECSAAEIESVGAVISQLLNVRATTDDIAKYYGKSRESVRTAMSRSYVPADEQPQQRKTWRFAFVSQIVPRSWRHLQP